MMSIYRVIMLPSDEWKTRRYDTSNFHVITIANEYTAGLHDLEKSLQKFGFNYKIHGIGRKWEGLTCKLRWCMEAINTLPDNTLVMTLDAYDTLVSTHPSEIISKWKDASRPIVVGAEDDCIDRVFCHAPANRWALMGKPSHMPYVNTGVIIGPVEHLRWLFKLAIIGPDSYNDQRAIAVISDIYPQLFHMDIHQHIVGNMRYPLFHRYEWSKSRNRIIYFGKEHVSTPCVIHTIGVWVDGTIRHRWAGKLILGDEYVEHTLPIIWKGFLGRIQMAIRRNPMYFSAVILTLLLLCIIPKLGIMIPPGLILSYVVVCYR